MISHEYRGPHPLHQRIEELEKQLLSKQAEIDRLMLEFCPEEMTKEQIEEQIEEWIKNQVPVDPRSLLPQERDCCGTFPRTPHRSTCSHYRGKKGKE